MLAMLALLSVHAGDYSVTDLVSAAQRGMSEDSIQRLAQQGAPWAVASEDVVPLLRAGLTPEVIAIMTEGKHPTREEEAAAFEPGPAYTPAPEPPKAAREYRDIDDAAWLRLRGVDLVVRLVDDTTTEGLLMSVTRTHLIFKVPESQTWSTPRVDVVSARRADGKPIVSVEEIHEELDREREVEWRRVSEAGERNERLRKTGGSLIAGGVVCGTLGLVGVVVGQVELNAAVGGIPSGDVGSVSSHATAGAAWSYVGYVGLASGIPMLVAGAIINGLAD